MVYKTYTSYASCLSYNFQIAIPSDSEIYVYIIYLWLRQSSLTVAIDGK